MRGFRSFVVAGHGPQRGRSGQTRGGLEGYDGSIDSQEAVAATGILPADLLCHSLSLCLRKRNAERDLLRRRQNLLDEYSRRLTGKSK